MKKLDAKAIKSRVDLVAVIRAQGVLLVRKGANFVAPCPFPSHREKTPSFTVNPARRIWKCFGCGKGGDVFEFLELRAGLTLPQAIEWLRGMGFVSGTPLVEPGAGAVPTMPPIETPAIDRPTQTVLDRVIAHWQKALAGAPRAIAYLKGRRLWHPELLRALKIGYASGSLARTLPGGGKLRRQLEQMGIFSKKGGEFFWGRVVIPLFTDGLLVNVYGRGINPKSEPKHLYLKGPQRGVFNVTGIRDAREVILTEAPLDALSLMVPGLGFTNVTTSYGANGFTADLRAELVRSHTQRVYCVYDPDPAGDQGADQLAHDLAGHGIEVRRVVLPPDVKDPNDFLKGGGTREQFQALLDAAQVVAAARTIPLAPRDVPPVPAVAAAAELVTAANPALPSAAADPVPASPAIEASPVRPPSIASAPAVPTALATVTLGDRAYHIESAPQIARGTMRVDLRAARNGRTFTDTVNLYADHARAKFVSRVFTAFRGQVPKATLEEDFFAVLDEVEAFSHKLTDTLDATPAATMTPAEREEALAFLMRPELISLIIEDFVQVGVVGEDDNKLLVYLVATSRLLPDPLSLSFISGSSGGKSWVLNRALDLMPEEEVFRFTRMSPRALFYDQPDRYKHKILHVEEAIGAKDADLGVRSMQSERRLSNLATMTDPKTGKLTTQETVVEGPLTYMTSSVEPLDYETSTRSFEVSIDESPEQTGRIVTRKLLATSQSGFQEKLAAEAILRRHRNAQRLLEHVRVMNPYAPQLTFPVHPLRIRREVDKYIGLMHTLALLFQHQRPIKIYTDPAGGTHRYVKVARSDIAIANRLMAIHLTRMTADLPGTAHTLLLKIQECVAEEAASRGVDPLTVMFSRRQLRDWLRWPDRHLITALEHLVRLEFIEVAQGSFGKRYVYTLSPDHPVLVAAGMSIDERIEALGLTPVSRLREPDEE